MVPRERPRKRIDRSSTNNALKMSLAIPEGSSLIFSPKHVTARTPPVGTPFSGQNSSESVVPILTRIRRSTRYSMRQKQAVCLWGQSCEGLGWCHIASLSCRPSRSRRRDQLPVAFAQTHPGDIFRSSLYQYQIVVRTNVGYTTVATSMVQDVQDVASLMWALQVLREWNPTWHPFAFMVDADEKKRLQSMPCFLVSMASGYRHWNI